MGTPLKLNGSDGDVKYFSTTEENYISYQIGLALRDGNRNSESSLDNLSGDTTVGTYSDTVYDQAVGTHGTTLTTTTTNTTLYQNIGTASESGTDFKRPIHWNTGLTPDSIQEMTDANFNACVDRFIAKVFASDYPGTFKLASSAPSADYSSFLTDLFTDTTVAGPGLKYSIWKRNAMTAPSTVRPMAVKRVSGTGAVDDFAGLQEMSDAEIKYSFGQRAKTRISASLIGTYQLRNSSQGVPSDAGTWVAKGTALDTNNQAPDVDYTTNYTGDYGANYASNSTNVFAGDYVTAYTGDFTGDYTGDFIGNYISSVGYASDYTGDFVGAYAGDVNYTRNDTSAYGGNYVSEVDYVGVYAGNYSGAASTGNYIGTGNIDYIRSSVAYTQEPIFFSGNYTGTGNQTFVGEYAGDFTGDYTGNYAGTVTSTRTSVGTYTGDYAGNVDYVSNSTSNFVGDYAGAVDSTSNSTANSTRNSTLDSNTAYVGEYTGDFTGDYSAAYVGDYVGNYISATIAATFATIDTYTLYVRTA